MGNKNTPPTYDIDSYIAALSATFRPARTQSETTHWLSTDEVVNAIKEIDPAAKVNPTLVFNALRRAGYDFCNRPGAHGISFKWMFHEI